MVRVPSHRASLDAVASGERVCSFLEVSERTPAQPTPRRRTVHPIRKATTTAMRCAWRTTAPVLFACVPCYYHLEACHTTSYGAPLRGLFTEVRGREILRRCASWAVSSSTHRRPVACE